MSEKNFDIIYEFNNPYFNRVEYILRFPQFKEPTYSILDLKERLSKIFNINKDNIIVKKIIPRFGGLECFAVVNVYRDPSFIKVEHEHVILKNLSKEERKKILEEKKKKKLEKKEIKKKGGK